MYYLDPFKYLLGALMTFTIWDAKVECKEDEYGVFNPPANMTCGEYMSDFLAQATGYMKDMVSVTSTALIVAYARMPPAIATTADTGTDANTSTT